MVIANNTRNKELVMSIVALKLPDVKRKWEERSQQCIYCAGELFQRWGQVNKRVKDVRVRNVKVDRYRCCDCKRTFRHCPEGNGQADQNGTTAIIGGVVVDPGAEPHRASRLVLSGLKIMVSHMMI